MTESQTSRDDVSPKTRKVSIQERSVLEGDMIVMNGHGVNRDALKQRFAEGAIGRMKHLIACCSSARKHRGPFSCVGLHRKS